MLVLSGLWGRQTPGNVLLKPISSVQKQSKWCWLTSRVCQIAVGALI